MTTSVSVGWQARLDLRRTALRERPQPGGSLAAVVGLLQTVGKPPVPLAVHALQRRGLWVPLRPGDTLKLELLLSPRADEAAARRWFDDLMREITRRDTGFEVCDAAGPHGLTHTLGDEPAADGGNDDEIALDFITPMSPAMGVRHRRLDPTAWHARIAERLADWLGQAQHLPAAPLEVNDALWHYDAVVAGSQRHSAATQPLLDGYRGPLLLRGAVRSWMPWLGLLEQIHLDIGTLSARGCFQILAPVPPWFARPLGDTGAIAKVADWVLSHTDADPVVDAAQGVPMDAVAIGQRLGPELAHGRWQPGPSKSFRLPKATAGWRVVEQFATCDAIVHRHLLDMLRPVFEAATSDAAHGLRPGRGRETALRALRDARRDGFVHVLRADIENCYASINPELALRCLDPWIPRTDLALRQALERAVRGDVVPPEGGVACRRQGLAQGSPLSPALANLVLSQVDRLLGGDPAAQVRLIRFADDLAVCGVSRVGLDTARARLEQALQALGLRLNAAKTQVVGPEEPVDFLGECVEVAEVDEIDAALTQRKPLLVAEPFASLHVQGEAVEVRHRGDVALTVPLRRVSQILVIQRASVSTTLISRCARLGVPLVVAMESGQRAATFAPENRAWYEVARRQGNHHESLTAAARLAAAVDLVDAKIGNCLAWIVRRPAAHERGLVEALQEQRMQGLSAGSLSQLRGHEAAAAKAFFVGLQRRFAQGPDETAFRAESRARGGPDRLNSMLNFGYHLLATRMFVLLRGQGLNPHLGLLHDADADYGTLVWDAVEPFRVHVDRTLLRLVNRRQLRPEEHFARQPHGVWLTAEGRRVVFAGLEETWNSRVVRWTLQDLMYAQAKAVRDWACGEGPLWWHRWGAADVAAPPGGAACAMGRAEEGPS